MSIEEQVARHYTSGRLEQAILSAVAEAGLDTEHLAPEDLAAFDEFHVGGREASLALFAQLGAAPDLHWLDVGCGIGGPARLLASMSGCRVSGIDLTAEFVEVAESLTRRTGLVERVDFRRCSALDLPFGDGGLDGAIMLHVGMNIADKPALFAAVRRVLRPGAVFAVYDIMRRADGPLSFPMPWAATAETSFVASADDYRAALRGAGFEITAERDRSEFAQAFFREQRAKADAGGPGLRAIMGPAAGERLANAARAVDRGLLGPMEMIARAR